MAITATIDRFEGDAAVLLVGEEEAAAAVANVPRSDLPEGAKARRRGALGGHHRP